ncbi:MAG: GNAT family N-acetyltransferase [Sphingomonadaceae bacterium]
MLFDTRLIMDLSRFTQNYGQLMRQLERAAVVDDLPIAQRRVLRELHAHGPQRSADLITALDMDSGHMSRVVAGLKAKQLIELERDPASYIHKKRRLVLTRGGHETAQRVANRQQEMLYAVLRDMSAGDRERLLAAVHDLGEQLFNLEQVPFEVREARGTDIGLLIDGIVFANTRSNYRFNDSFADHIVGQYAAFAADPQPGRKVLLLCERQTAMLGSIMMTADKDDRTIAVVRQLWVANYFEGYGIGTKLLGRCARMAAEMGYQHIRAEALKGLSGEFYAKRGWKLERSQSIELCGRPVVRKYWSRSLKGVA